MLMPLSRDPRMVEYYLGGRSGGGSDAGPPEPERTGVWCGSGARSLGLVGRLDEAGEAMLRALLAGCDVSGKRLVPPVPRVDPRGRVPAAPLVAAVAARAAERGTEPAALLADERLAAVFSRAARAVDVAHPRGPAATIPAQVAGRLAASGGLCPHVVYRRAGVDVFARALRFADARVDVRRPGLSLVFTPPKSASVLFALGEGRVPDEVRAAHRTAVVQTLEYLEPLCARVRRGREHHPVATEGWCAVAFEHEASRGEDPLLHTHVVVPNTVRDKDGRWRAFHIGAVYREVLSGRYAYHVLLRGELTRRLGVAWEPVRGGIAEIAGVPFALRVLFSSRRKAIQEHLRQRGRSGPRAARTAVFATRADKRPAATACRRREWARRACAAGFDPADVVAAVVDRTGGSQRADLVAVRDRVLAAAARTNDPASTFDRCALRRAVCAAVPAGAPVTAARLRELETALVADPVVTAALTVASATPRHRRRGLPAPELPPPRSQVAAPPDRQDTPDPARVHARWHVAGDPPGAPATGFPAAPAADAGRQREPWERAALAAVRGGDPLGAFVSYAAAGRVHVADSGAQVRERIVADYLAARRSDPAAEVVMVTSARRQARTLNNLVRARLLEAGALSRTGPSVPRAGGVQLRVGDAVVVASDRYRLGLVTGMRGQVRDVSSRRGAIVEVGTRQVVVPPTDLAAGVLDHGYALTCRAARSVSVDVALVYAARGLSARAGSVALSRGRVANHVYATLDTLLASPGDRVGRPRAEQPPHPAPTRMVHGAVLEWPAAPETWRLDPHGAGTRRRDDKTPWRQVELSIG